MELSLSSRLGLLALAGAAGTLARFGTYALVAKTPLAHLPAATLIVNVLGSLAFGVVWALAEQQDRMSDTTKWLLLTGFMGAFTTFSTFAFESGKLMQDGHWGMAIGNIVLNNVLGIGAFFAGWWLVR